MLQLYFNLLNSVTGAQQAVSAYLMGSGPTTLDSKTHLGVLQIVLEHLAPWKQVVNGRCTDRLGLIQSCTQTTD